MAFTTNLLSGERDWRDIEIGGGTPSVRLERLHYDRATKASTSLVEFPAGWTRPDTGWYPCAEELHVISGSITVSGLTYEAGGYGYMPPFYSRIDSSSDGCLALAWFSGAPGWNLGTAEDQITHEGFKSSNLVGYRTGRTDVIGRSSTYPKMGERRMPGAFEIVDLKTWDWGMFLDEEPFPTVENDVFQRWWI